MTNVIIGYPIQTDREIDFMNEMELAKMWEDLCKPTDETTLKMAAKSLNYAINELDATCDFVNEACETLVDTAEGDRIASILQDMESRLKDIREMQSKLAKGES